MVTLTQKVIESQLLRQKNVEIDYEFARVNHLHFLTHHRERYSSISQHIVEMFRWLVDRLVISSE